MRRRRLHSAFLATALAAVAGLAGSGPALERAHARQLPSLDWKTCAERVECATATVPRDHRHPSRGTIKLALARLPAQDPGRRVGSVFLNLGGPGLGSVGALKQFGYDAWGGLTRTHDVIGFDPRGVGASRPAADCSPGSEKANQPFLTPTSLERGAYVRKARRDARECLRGNRKKKILPYISTANVARDLDLLRAAIGEDRLDYLGYSYGTFLGATYQSMFADRVGRMVLDAPPDPALWVRNPMKFWRGQSRGFERSLDRFLKACRADQKACSGFGGEDPRAALDDLVARLREAPIPPAGPRGKSVDGDDLLVAIREDLYSRRYWGELAKALSLAERGDGSGIRYLTDLNYTASESATALIDALDQRYPGRVNAYLRWGERSYRDFPHFWWNSGYGDAPFAFYRVKPRGIHRGPFFNSPSAPTTLVIGTTWDPITPYSGAKALRRRLGDARLLTMRGDAHTAHGWGYGCVDKAVAAYLARGRLPRRGAVCRQPEPFSSHGGDFKSLEAEASADSPGGRLRDPRAAVGRTLPPG